jgi:hypothetical protein
LGTPRPGDIIAHSGDNPGYKALPAAPLQRKASFIMMTNGERGYDEIIATMERSLPPALI